MGLGAFPASDPHFLGMLGMHGTYEANLAMHGCDVMVDIGARFDDRVTGKLDGFLAGLEEDPHRHRSESSINKNVRGRRADRRRRRARARGHDPALEGAAGATGRRRRWPPGGSRSRAGARASRLSFRNSDSIIKPQYALQRLYAAIKDRDLYITTEVGQHQMWAAQYLQFEKPNHWMTSGGLGTMGYGLPAAIGVQIAHPDALVIDIAGEASILMNIQEMSTAAQYRLPVKVFILNNQ